MFIVVNQATITPHKSDEAVALWKRFAAYHRKQPEVVDCVVLRPLQGVTGRIMSSCRYKSLTAFDQCRTRIAKDPEYQALMKEHRERLWTVPNTLEQTLYDVAE